MKSAWIISDSNGYLILKMVRFVLMTMVLIETCVAAERGKSRWVRKIWRQAIREQNLLRL
jgi:hypothetical protein